MLETLYPMRYSGLVALAVQASRDSVLIRLSSLEMSSHVRSNVLDPYPLLL